MTTRQYSELPGAGRPSDVSCANMLVRGELLVGNTSVQGVPAPSVSIATSVPVSTNLTSATLTSGPVSGVARDWYQWTGGGGPATPNPTPPRAVATNTHVAKRRGTRELINGIDWVTVATNSTFQGNSGAAGFSLSADAQDILTTIAGNSNGTGFGYNAGDGVNFGLTIAAQSNAFVPRLLRTWLRIHQCTVTVRARLADGTEATTTISAANGAYTNAAVDVVWTGGTSMLASFLLTSHATTGGGIYALGCALV